MAKDWRYIVWMPDGSKWSVPVDVIARNRAAYYADEFGGDIERSLAEDTWPLFERHEGEIHDWASNNMDWENVKAHATKEADRLDMTPDQFAEGWVNGEHEVSK